MFSRFREELPVAKEFYIISILNGFVEIVTPLWVIYFLMLGLSPAAFGLIFAVYFISQFVFEIPTGAIADHFGRKISVTLSFFIGGFLFTGVALSSTFWPFLILFALFGASDSLHSGAFNAWLIDTLHHYKKGKQSHRYLSRTTSLFQLALIPSFFAASIVIMLGVTGGLSLLAALRALWLVGAFFNFAMAAVAYFFGREEYFKPRKRLRIMETFKENFRLSREGISHCLHHPVLLLLVLADAILGFCFAVFIIGYQPFLKDFLHIPIVWFGAISALSAFFGFLAVTYSGKLISKRHERDALLLVYLLFLTGLLLFSQSLSVIIAMIGFYLFWSFAIVAMPLWTHYFNKYIPSRIRATTESVANMFKTLFWAAGVYIGYGLISERFGLPTALHIAILVGSIGLAIMFLVKKD
jgi:MFS family permease